MSRRSSVWGKGRACSTVLIHTVSIQCILSLCHDCVCREASKIIANYFDYCRVKEYIHMGLYANIIDPDKGANIARKLERLRVSGLNKKDHPNLRLSPAISAEGWTSNLADLPPVSFATLYTHFIECIQYKMCVHIAVILLSSSIPGLY